MAFTSTGGNLNPATQANVATKESIYDKILLLGADETPILSKIGTSNVTNIKHSWLIDEIANPTRTPKLEISDFTEDGASTKQKKENAVEIFTDDIMVSYSMRKIAMYGGKELEYQSKKKMKEHKLRMEKAILGLDGTTLFDAPVVRDGSTAGKMAGIFYYLAKGDNAFASGVRGNITAFDSTNDWTGTDTTLDWDKFNQVLQSVYDGGEVPKDVYIGADLKPAINAFVTRQLGNEKAYNGMVSSIETDFGTVNIHLHRMFNQANGLNNAFIAGNFEYMKNGLLYSTMLEDVNTSKTADAKRIYTESCLEVRNANAFSAGVGLTA